MIMFILFSITEARRSSNCFYWQYICILQVEMNWINSGNLFVKDLLYHANLCYV